MHAGIYFRRGGNMSSKPFSHIADHVEPNHDTGHPLAEF
jgi:hypothetical protein